MTTPLKRFSVSEKGRTKKGTLPSTRLVFREHTFYGYYFAPSGLKRNSEQLKLIDEFVNEIGKKFPNDKKKVELKISELKDLLKSCSTFDPEGVKYLLEEQS